MKKLIIVLFIVVMIMGCAKEQATTKFAKITFNVDQSQLAEEYICPDVGISFHPPKNWEQISSELLISVKDNLVTSKDTSNINIIPLNVFMDMEKSFTCFLSTFNNELPVSDTGENYLNEFRLINQDLKFNEGSFAHNKLDFHQLTFTKNNLVTIKLIAIINDQKIFMIDYVVPSKYYEEELRAIESSIGSIKKQKNEIGSTDS